MTSRTLSSLQQITPPIICRKNSGYFLPSPPRRAWGLRAVTPLHIFFSVPEHANHPCANQFHPAKARARIRQTCKREADLCPMRERGRQARAPNVDFVARSPPLLIGLDQRKNGAAAGIDTVNRANPSHTHATIRTPAKTQPTQRQNNAGADNVRRRVVSIFPTAASKG